MTARRWRQDPQARTCSAGQAYCRPGASACVLWCLLAAWAGAAASAGGCVAETPLRSVPRGLQSESRSERIEACVEAARTRNEKVTALLIERLEDQAAEVRFYAIAALDRITGRRLGYRCYGSAGERARSVARWRKWLKDRLAADKKE